MNIPNIPATQLVETDGSRKGYMTDNWYQFFMQLITQLQRQVGTEGFVVPQVSSASSSVTPPAAGGQVKKLENAFANGSATPSQGVVSILGTLIFDPNETNGGGGTPNGQLKILLNDGTFHAVTNS